MTVATTNFTTTKDTINTSLKTTQERLIAEFKKHGQLGLAHAIPSIIDTVRANVLLDLYENQKEK